MSKKIIAGLSFVLIASALWAQGHWFMAQTETATIQSILATSELVEAQYEGKYLYPPVNVLDGDFSTTWCEADAGGPGIGESITIEFAEPVSFDEIQIVNGFASGSDFYHKNNRVASILLTQVAGKHFQQKSYKLLDDVAGWQPIKFDLPQTARTLTLKIEAVYKGTKYDDTCLSDLRLLYKGRVIPFKNVETLRAAQEENSRMLLSSDSASFKKNFLSLFQPGSDGRRCLYLASPSGFGYVLYNPEGDSIQMNAAEYQAPIAENGLEAWIEDNKIYNKESFEGYHRANYDYLVHPLITWTGRGGPSYELGNYRILETTTTDYVETKTVILLKLDGRKGVYVNGAYYSIPDPSRVLRYETWNDQGP
jgi:hypothetical protein